jgi:hypothetical protein
MESPPSGPCSGLICRFRLAATSAAGIQGRAAIRRVEMTTSASFKGTLGGIGRAARPSLKLGKGSKHCTREHCKAGTKAGGRTNTRRRHYASAEFMGGLRAFRFEKKKISVRCCVHLFFSAECIECWVTIHPESIGWLQSAGQDYNGATRMILTSSTKLSGYEIQSALAAGGTGNVYRALDTKLRWDVALKILPETFARDAYRLVRFEREARLRVPHPVVPRRGHLATRAKPEGMQFLGGCSAAMPLISVLPPLV